MASNAVVRSRIGFDIKEQATAVLEPMGLTVSDVMRIVLTCASATLQSPPLKNDWAGYRDAPVDPDWLLINFANEDILRLERTGTHADLLD